MGNRVVTEVHIDISAGTQCPSCGRPIVLMLHPQWNEETTFGEVIGDVMSKLAVKIEKHTASHVN